MCPLETGFAHKERTAKEKLPRTALSLAVFHFGDFGGRCKGGSGAAVLIGAARRANRVVLKAEDGGMVAGFGMFKQDAFAVIGLAGHNRQAVILPQVDPGAVERGGFFDCDCALDRKSVV